MPLSEVPRFLGHRLYIIFKLAGVYFTIFSTLKKIVNDLKSSNKVVEKLKILIDDEAAVVELQVLGIVGKMFSGPWTKIFYTDLNKTQNPINTMHTVFLEI